MAHPNEDDWVMGAWLAEFERRKRLGLQMSMPPQVSGAGYATGANADAPAIMVSPTAINSFDAADARLQTDWSRVTWSLRLWDDGLIEEFTDGEWRPR